MSESSNKRIAKNTIMLYLRMFLTMIVGLYTSRVVLATLGVEDYGIYGVVGGVVAMLGFLNASMSGATSRFLTFELGRGDKERLAKTFSSALIVHCIIALIVLVVSETVGLWFLCNKLVIPEGRMAAAHWVFQLSILSAMLGITQVPYNASIISHEKMDVYAYVEILNVTLKLLIVYLLVIGNFDKLILYAILTLAVSVIVMMVYRIYCLRRFEECHFHWIWDKEYLKPLLSFSGWDLFGNMTFTIRQQGVNFLINMFFGVVFNAASGIASTVQGMISGFCFNVIAAFRPQIIKLYSAGRIKESVGMLYTATKYATLLVALVAIPISVELDYLMKLWLKNPPLYATLFCKIMLINSCFTMCDATINIGLHATGKIKKISVYASLCNLLTLVLLFSAYKMGFKVEYAYYINIFITILMIWVKGWILGGNIPEFKLLRLIIKVGIPILAISTIMICTNKLIIHNMEDGAIRCIVVFTISSIVGVFASLFIALNKPQREKALNFATSRISHLWRK